MKTAGILTFKLAGLVVVLLCWRASAERTFSFLWSVALVWGGIVLVPVVAAIGRWLLNRRPTAERATLLTIPVHYLEGILLGCALIVAFRFTQAYPIKSIPFPKAISLPALWVLGVLATLTVLNLAIGALGLPFATALSKKLTTSWLYARCRNPMGLFSLLFSIVGALWLQSLHAFLWTTLWLAPAWILFVRLYEERELEIRFGESYLRYRAQTPFF
ncbi:MAG TPA: methyltransferase [Terriglobales bacterium]|nr:methyltransferase [Terriglobales bacterium]